MVRKERGKTDETEAVTVLTGREGREAGVKTGIGERKQEEKQTRE